MEQKHSEREPGDAWTVLEPRSTCPVATQIGRHVVIELCDCDAAMLNDVDVVRAHLLEAAARSLTTVVGEVFHKFGEIGVSGVVVVAESHISIHTWPEYGYAAVDFFTCGSRPDPHCGLDYLRSAFHAKSGCVLEIGRGMRNPPASFEAVPQLPTTQGPLKCC